MKPDSIDSLLEQAASLKKKLVEFGRKPSIFPHFQEMLWNMSDDINFSTSLSQAEQIVHFDTFLFEWKLPNGDTVRNRLWKTQTKALSPEEREMLAGWEDRIEGVFHVENSDNNGAICYNIVDGLSYRIFSNVGASKTKLFFKKDSFIYMKIVPVKDIWVLSGHANPFPDGRAKQAIAIAQEIAQNKPELAFRDPNRLQATWRESENLARAFEECFSSDIVVVKPAELADIMLRFFDYHTNTFRGTDGKTVAERAGMTDAPIQAPPIDLLDMTEVGIRSVGLFAHPKQGLCFLIEYATILEAFEKPQKASRGHHRRLVLEYIEEPSAPAAALERLANEDVSRLSKMIGNAIKRPDFDWARDHVALLSPHKPVGDSPAYPQMIIIDTSRFEKYF